MLASVPRLSPYHTAEHEGCRGRLCYGAASLEPVGEAHHRRADPADSCVIIQSSGKKRVIDDAAKGGQSALSSDANKLVLCSLLRPAQHIAAAMSFLTPFGPREVSGRRLLGGRRGGLA